MRPGVDLNWIQQQIRAGRYRLKPHVVRHMMEEGFEEAHCLEAVLDGDILEECADEDRCLVVGTFHWMERTTSSLHVICNCSQPDRVELVTAYIPQPPAWRTPIWRGNAKA